MCCGHCHGCHSYVERLNLSTPSLPEEVRGSIKTGLCCLLPFPCLVTNIPPVENVAIHTMQWPFSQGLQEHLRPWVKTLLFPSHQLTKKELPPLSWFLHCLCLGTAPLSWQHPQLQLFSSASQSPLYGHGLSKKVFPLHTLLPSKVPGEIDITDLLLRRKAPCAPAAPQSYFI